ncbi:MAG: PaaI family thioesterase [Victivallaceae bacterium]|nr:PaaI family thioesterase [Victivallaceae bacterium]
MIMTKINKKLNKIRDQVHPQCIACSLTNTNGLHLKFDVADDKSVKADFKYNKVFEGYPGILHGGIISSILDSAMCNCMFACGNRHPVATCRKATVSARITQSSHSLYLLEAEIVQNGEVKVTTKGKFYDQPDLVDIVNEP